ncbi:MAG: phenylalanine--tRNA ligase subunit alpha [Proteobacteria bacterium]|nr:phenylalanine--tRNA ligase subunit alpha [Pseudomonadota bacterium]MDA1354731.1 phenylalanine--tRNA ligase subunit alpha [Pseudomonadota bacterium]
MQDLEALKAEILVSFEKSGDAAALDVARVAALGKKGSLTARMKSLGGLDPEARKTAGQTLNRIKDELIDALDARRAALEGGALNARLGSEKIDITLPIRPETQGRIHPISQVLDEMVAIFGDMGFSVAEGPDIEDDFHNFTALNIPPEHPARQMHDTFYFPEREDGSRLLLRTHTSPVQIRTMKAGEPPYRIIAPGRTYRCDSDITHAPMFHQIEGLVVDEHTHMGHLKGCLIDFAKTFFEVANLPVRFRPSYFPFTEPSAEMDIGCARDRGVLRIGEGADWMEILGCGMVNPRVLDMSGVDSTRYQGFAFGLGVERSAMLKYGIPDLRTFYDADARWLRHYGFAAGDVPSLVGGLTR